MKIKERIKKVENQTQTIPIEKVDMTPEQKKTLAEKTLKMSDAELEVPGSMLSVQQKRNMAFAYLRSIEGRRETLLSEQ